MSWTRRWTWVPAGVLALLLGGCGGDPGPRFEAEPTPTVASTPSESASPAAETAQQFIERWASLSAAMQNNGDSASYRQITKGCRPCRVLAGRVDEYYSAGGYIQFTGLTIKNAVQRPSTADTEVFDVTVAVGNTTYQPSADAEEQTLPGGTSTYRMTLRGSPGAWTLADYTELAS